MNKIHKFTLLLLPIISTSITLATNHTDNKSSVEFFISNNTDETSFETAFNRLQGEAQQKLQSETSKVLKKRHIEQGKIENLLGTYTISKKQKTIADNSEKFITAYYQKIPSKKIFNTAKELAIMLRQESVAVFIPDRQHLVTDTIVQLKSHKYTINETIKIICEQLPRQYQQAYSLHLNNNVYSSFDNVTVAEIEWLGNKINPKEIRKSFPEEKVIYRYGKAYLVYKNGQKKPL